MDIFKPSRRGLVRGSAALGAALAAGSVRVVESQGRQVLHATLNADIQILDPPFTLTSSESAVQDCLFVRLITYQPGAPGETMRWAPQAAEMIEQIDDTHIAFRLKPGFMWTNGFGELTAEDVKYSFERVVDPSIEAPYYDDWAPLDHVEVTDRYSGVIVLQEPFAMLWTTTLPGESGRIVCKAAVEALPDRKFTVEPPATSGPYVLHEWVPKQRIVLVRDENWPLERPAYDEIHLIPIEDSMAAELAFEAGDVDYTHVASGSLARLRDDPPAGATLLEHAALDYLWLGISNEHPKLADLRVRRAIQMAVDVHQVLDAAYFGTMPPATGMVSPGLIGYREAPLIPFEAQPEEARRLLEEAGVADSLELELVVQNTTERLAAAQVIQANLAAVGVEVEILPLDGGTFWSYGMESEGDTWKDFQLQLMQFATYPDPGWITMWFVCDQVGVWNWERWCSEEFTDLHNQAMRELDQDKRDVMYRRMQDLMEESGSYRVLTNGVRAMLVRDTVVPAMQPIGVPMFYLFRPADA